jgi:hypothetical protein
VGPNFTSARYPIWSPDGKCLLLIGYTSQKAYESSAIHWWRVPLNEGHPVRTGAHDALVRAGLDARDFRNHPPTPYANVPTPSCWLAAPSRVIFSIENGDTRSLWETGI